MARRFSAPYQSEPFSALATWARRLAIFSAVATIVSILVVRFGFLEMKPALATFFGALACAGLSILVSLAAFAAIWQNGTRGMGRILPAIHAQVQEPWPGDSAHGRLVIDGRFVWNGHTAQLARSHDAAATPVYNWTPRDLPPEGLAYLHGFAWLRDLRAVGGDVARATARTCAADWIATQSRWAPLTFRTDVLAQRVSAWLAHYDFLAVGGDPSGEAGLRQS